MLRAISLIGALVFLPAGASAQQPCTTDARVVVAEVYQRVLERSFDEGGAAYVNRLENGQASVRDVVRDVAKSSEHTQRFLPGDTPDQRASAIRYLYKHLLGRAADADGLRHHVGVANSQGLPAVIDALIGSAEYQQKFGDSMVPGSSTRYCGAPQVSRTRQDQGRRQGQMRFAGMDRNNDGVIARGEWNGSRESFIVHDWNGDDVLSGDEVRVGGRRAVQRDEDDFNPAAPGRLNSWTEATFNNLDRNRDGRVSSSEWYYDAESFVRADRNRDGALARNEFLGTVDAMDDDRNDRFENLDGNRNGRIERAEWHGSDDAFEWLDHNRDNVLSRAEVLGSAKAADQFTMLDANRDGRLTTEEWHWSRRSFNQQDANRDGALTRREFTTGGAVPTTGR